MSIVPIHHNDNGRQVSVFNPFSDLWDPFLDFPFPDFPFSRIFPEFNWGTSVNSRLDWRETPTAHVLKAALPGFGNEDVLVELQDERVLQISTDSGNFMSRFKLPDNAMIEQLKASMNNGVLTVTVPKEESSRPSVRVVEISGDD
ncbi:hypothetical protein FNV43_RR05066 [Rhamnella rubrinervis]|uniref:SHSP domain-containing protein n=1 Tax=Rhamnella rubrinervis TaxID=2594499 RepID=A0A8K0HN86_9ROSA|nr:hypothetical protein FNV43_RR13208 [Rhamnella rubrinervis]KAF3454618.1 hypothetical protein FNV43_RR05066 [Rhamnella rubrinervis]